MTRLNNIVQFFKKQSFNRLLVLLGVIVLLFLMRGMLNLILMTFVFIYFINRCENVLTKLLEKNNIKINSKITVVLVFIAFVAVIAFVMVDFLPLIIKQTKQIVEEINGLYVSGSSSVIIKYFQKIIDNAYDSIFSAQGLNYITTSITYISKVGVDFILSLILTLFFLLGKDTVIRFTLRIKQSKMYPLYKEIEFFGVKFLSSFGKVIEVQVIIALVNGIISTIFLSVIGFPNLLGFGIMIMILGLIPVAGVMISLVPLSLVAFNFGGFIYVVYIFIMIIIVHSFESYVLNPKLMASKTKLPVFYTFVVLIVSEHFAGVWGLLFGIPLFIFVLEVFEVPMDSQ